MSHLMSELGLVRHTVRSLLLPKRLVPILLVCVPLVVTQGRFSQDPLAVPLGILTCLAFVLLAPVSWRVLFPEDKEEGQMLIRLVLYVGVGAGVILTLGVVIPKLLGMGMTFLTQRTTLLVTGALYVVGGWGLGRDVGFESSLERERARSASLAREAEQAQLLALRSHLDPHFLFNTLNAIAEWCREDGLTAEKAVLELAAMLRTLLEGVKARSWPLQKELELVRTLFGLHQLRAPSAFSLDWQVSPEAHMALIPPLILLPFAENAMTHGPNAGHRGVVSLMATVTQGRLKISISNPGAYQGPRPGSDGLPTVDRRLKLSYGEDARWRISGTSNGTVAELDLPVAGPNMGAS